MEKKKKVYHVELDVVDDVEKFREETGDKSDDLELVPEDVILRRIKEAVTRFGEMELKGVYVTNASVTYYIKKD